MSACVLKTFGDSVRGFLFEIRKSVGKYPQASYGLGLLSFIDLGLGLANQFPDGFNRHAGLDNHLQVFLSSLDQVVVD